MSSQRFFQRLPVRIGLIGLVLQLSALLMLGGLLTRSFRGEHVFFGLLFLFVLTSVVITSSLLFVFYRKMLIVRIHTILQQKNDSVKTIREANTRYRNLIENAPLGIVSFAPDGRILEVNTMLVAIFGAPSVESLSRMNMLTAQALVQSGIAADIQLCVETGLPMIEEKLFTSEWGRQVYLRYFLTPITDRSAQLKEVHALLEDSTDRRLVEKALKESEAEYRSLFKNMLSGLAYHKIVVDEAKQPIDYIFLEVNEAYERLTGLGKAVIGRRITEIIPDIRQHEPNLIQIFGNVALTGEEISLEFFFEPFGLWFSVAAYSAEKGYFVTIYDDISERKWAEESLHQLNEKLEQRVDGRTRELQKANAALQESLITLERTQNQLVQSEKMAALGGLVAGIAHEINTPVGIGVTAVSYLYEKSDELKQHYQQNTMKRSDFEKYLELASESTAMILINLQRAADLILGFKQVAVDQTSWGKRRFNLKEYLHKILLSLHPKLKRTSHVVSVTCPQDIELTSYPGAFSQIVANLVINTLVHGFENIEQGKIDITVFMTENALHLHYYDNGIGISEEKVSRIFDPFYTTKRGQGGSGLGLNIVYNLVTQRLNGQIECQSRVGSGTSFFIQMPLEHVYGQPDEA